MVNTIYICVLYKVRYITKESGYISDIIPILDIIDGDTTLDKTINLCDNLDETVVRYEIYKITPSYQQKFGIYSAENVIDWLEGNNPFIVMSEWPLNEGSLIKQVRNMIMMKDPNQRQRNPINPIFKDVYQGIPQKHNEFIEERKKLGFYRGDIDLSNTFRLYMKKIW